MSSEGIHRRARAILARISPLALDTPAAGAPDLSKDGADGMDSVAALQLVLAVEEEFGITVNDEDIGPENFADLDSLCRYIEQKIIR